jgi:hypothetical protein
MAVLPSHFGMGWLAHKMRSRCHHIIVHMYISRITQPAIRKEKWGKSETIQAKANIELPVEWRETF